MKAPRTRNLGTLTEAAYWGKLRSELRWAFRHWKPAQEAVNRHSRPYKGTNKRRKTEVQCQECYEWFPPSQIDKDHIIPCGSLYNKKGVATPQSVWGFIKRLTEEDPMLYQPICKACHKLKTKQERKKRRIKK